MLHRLAVVDPGLCARDGRSETLGLLFLGFCPMSFKLGQHAVVKEFQRFVNICVLIPAALLDQDHPIHAGGLEALKVGPHLIDFADAAARLRGFQKLFPQARSSRGMGVRDTKMRQGPTEKVKVFNPRFNAMSESSCIIRPVTIATLGLTAWPIGSHSFSKIA